MCSTKYWATMAASMACASSIRKPASPRTSRCKAASSHGLDALRSMRDRLKEEAQQQAVRAQQEKEAQRQRQQEADVFRNAVKEVQPLKPSGRVTPHTAKPLPIPHQHLRDEANA